MERLFKVVAELLAEVADGRAQIMVLESGTIILAHPDHPPMTYRDSTGWVVESLYPMTQQQPNDTEPRVSIGFNNRIKAS